MNPISYLKKNAPGFDTLSNKEQEAIAHFTLLWGFFEARALNSNGSARAIKALTREWSSQGRLIINPFTDSIRYFQQRYFSDGVKTKHFDSLKLRPNDCRHLVESFLKAETINSSDSVAALLIIVYRLRNNLFHGIKWAYGIQGQLDNFTHANTTLVNALSIVGIR